MGDQKKAGPKKEFQKPEIKKVPLAIEEAVLAACKSNTMGTGPGGAMTLCNNSVMGTVTACSTYGS